MVVADETAALWERRFEELVRYRQENGDCAVPKALGLLGSWTSRQRELAKKRKLTPERAAALREIGFVWDANDAAWDTQFKMLQEYYNENGHSYVPSAFPSLGIWVAKQRGKARCDKLSAERVARLNSVDFVWSPADAEWLAKYAALREYFATTGHSSIPFQGGPLERLGWWANTQRQAYRKGRLSEERIRLLNKLRFVWRPPRFGKRERDVDADVEPETTPPKRRRCADEIESSLYAVPSHSSGENVSALSSASTRGYQHSGQESVQHDRGASHAPVNAKPPPDAAWSFPQVSEPRESISNFPVRSRQSPAHRMTHQSGPTLYERECRNHGMPQLPPVSELFAMADARYRGIWRPRN